MPGIVESEQHLTSTHAFASSHLACYNLRGSQVPHKPSAPNRTKKRIYLTIRGLSLREYHPRLPEPRYPPTVHSPCIDFLGSPSSTPFLLLPWDDRVPVSNPLAILPLPSLQRVSSCPLLMCLRLV